MQDSTSFFCLFCCKLAADGYKCEHEEADREVIDEILSDVFVEENVGDAADNSTLWFSHFRILELHMIC